MVSWNGAETGGAVRHLVSRNSPERGRGVMAGELISAALFVCAAPQAVDGDTIRCRGVGLIRLVGIDSPELAGHCRAGRVCTPGDGPAAKRAMAALLRQGPVTCAPTGRDKYGRLLARCTVRQQDLSCTMVSLGYAVVRYSRLKCQF